MVLRGVTAMANSQDKHYLTGKYTGQLAEPIYEPVFGLLANGLSVLGPPICLLPKTQARAPGGRCVQRLRVWR